MDFDIKGIKKRFLAINNERLLRTQNALRWKQRDFLELLPIFFHINHAMLPGFVTKSTPAGVPLFSPSKVGLDALKRLSKSFTFKKRALRKYEIHSIFIMGSVGTIAQSEKSDFDIWICYDPELSEGRLAELRAKCVAIEGWADSIGLEVHFFVMDADAFRKGEVSELSSESSGSTQHHLLLEEFYRTSLLVAGRMPIWWLIPPDQEKNYDELAHDLLHKRFVQKNEVIDFGGLSRVPAEEFFGAALWQVYKGIDSPYKSVLKIMLMETYASAYPDVELLSLQYKRMVYEGVTDLNQLDPYIILLNRLQEYLRGRNEPQRLELVRRCFYFKVGIALSQGERSKDDWQRIVLLNMADNWKWSQTHIETMDSRDDWKINRVLVERKLLVDELTQSYLSLSNFARSNNQLSSINQKDLNILGRKLYAAFERKAGKIELVNRGISENVFEQKVNILQHMGKDDSETWTLQNEIGKGKEFNITQLKRGRSVVELLTWCHFNRLISHGTLVSLDVKSGILTLKEIKSVLGALDGAFPNGKLTPTSTDCLEKPPTISSGGVFVNVGLDPLPSHSRRGMDIVSDKTDILNYSGFSYNLALSFDMVIITSWQEILTYRYSGVDGLLECACQYLRWNLNSGKSKPFQIPAHSYSSTHSIAIAKRIAQLLQDVISVFYVKGKFFETRYIIEVQNSFFVLYKDNENFNFDSCENKETLFNYLSRPQERFVPIKADRFALMETVVPHIVRKNKEGIIQLFYQREKGMAHIYILDEYGSLFYQHLPFHDDHALLNQYILFFGSVLNRMNFVNDNNVSSSKINDIEYCKVVRLANGRTQFERKVISDNRLIMRYFHLQAIVNVVDQQTVFTVYCGDKEFSSFDHGKTLFHDVAKHVFSLRKSAEKYPIYITDLDLATNLLGQRAGSKAQIIEYLNYKKRIEEKLNNELNNF